MKEITKYLDSQGRISIWPSKRSSKLDILKYLASSFHHGSFYTEKDVNQRISEMHTFNDYFLLRRELIDHRLLVRTTDGSKYWKGDLQAYLGQDNLEKLKIVNATPEDAEYLKDIYLCCGYLKDWTGIEHTSEYIDKILWEGDLPPGGHREFYHVKSIYDKDQSTPVAFLEYYHGYPQSNVLFISSLFIHKDSQNKGYGREIVEWLSVAASQVGYSKLAIGVHLKNWPALRFWSKNGFNHIVGIYGDTVHAPAHYSIMGLQKILD